MTAPRPDRAWLHLWAQAVRVVTLDAFTPVNTCILTSRVGADVLAARGYDRARLAPVWVNAANLPARRAQHEGTPMHAWPDEAWAVGVDEHGSGGPGWDGHLVLVLPRDPDHPDRLLVDLTADQFDRPARGLRVQGPVFMGIPAGTPWTPADPFFATVGGGPEVGTTVAYRPMQPGHPSATSWRTAPDATRDVSDVVEAVLRVLADTEADAAYARLGAEQATDPEYAAERAALRERAARRDATRG